VDSLTRGQPKPDRCKLDEGKVVGGEFVVACRDPAAAKEPIATSYSAPGVLAEAAHKTGRAKADFEDSADRSGGIRPVESVAAAVSILLVFPHDQLVKGYIGVPEAGV
jgi:hypothetical protein